MSETADGAASLAWRLLATLEGGSLILAASALFAYTARGRSSHRHAPCTNIAITNTTSDLGRTLKTSLEAHGCTVSTLSTESLASNGYFDALVVVGAQHKTEDLDGFSGLITEDVYDNIKLLESLSSRVSRGGCIAWVSTRASTRGSFSGAADAFDAVLHASLVHVAKVFQCEPVWAGGCDSPEHAADRLVATLMAQDTQHDSWSSIRHAAHTVGEYLYRWLKMVT